MQLQGAIGRRPISNFRICNSRSNSVFNCVQERVAPPSVRLQDSVPTYSPVSIAAPVLGPSGLRVNSADLPSMEAVIGPDWHQPSGLCLPALPMDFPGF